MGNSNVEDIYELSPLQQGMLLHSAHDGATDMYLSQQTYLAEGSLDPEILIAAWEAAVRAHPAMRTSFHWEGLDRPLQVVHRELPLPVSHHDWSDVDSEQVSKRLEQLRVDDRATGFNLAVAPLQRLNIVRLGTDAHCLVWTYHHLLMDGWSVPIFMAEVLAHYRRLAMGTPPPPPAPPFRDYIAWLQRQDPAATKSFWTQNLAGLKPSHLAPLRPWDPQRGTGPVDRRFVNLPESVGSGLRQAAVRHRVTFGTLVQAAWAIVLGRYTGGSEVTFGCASSGRPPELPQVDRMVGMFANTLPVRVALPTDGDLGTWLRHMQGEYARMRQYEYTPLADVKRWAGAPGQQLFQSLLVLETYTFAAETGGSGARLAIRRENLYDKISFPLTLTAAPGPVPELQLLIHRERFDPGFIDDVLARLDATFLALVTAERIGPVVAAAGPLAADPDSAAPAVDPVTEHPPTPPAAPSTAREDAIAEIYRDILGLTEVDVTASFFELGGDSFDAVRAIGRIDGASLGLLAAHPSVRALASALDSDPADETDDGLDGEIAELERQLSAKRAERAHRAAPHQLVPVPREDAMVCARQQEALWFMNQLEPASTSYHIPFALRLRGPLDVAALERALHGLVVRHEALRTRFVSHGGLPRQVIDPPPATPRPLPVTRLRAAQVVRWATDECDRPFDLAAGPVFRAALARTARDDHALVAVFHHIVADGWSTQVLAGELAELYAAEVAGREAGLAPLDLQPADHAVWQRHWLASAQGQRQLDYWRDTLADAATVDFPADRPRPAQPTFRGATIGRRIPLDVAAAARDFARENRVSLLAVLQATLLTVLHRYTGQRDLPIGSLFSGRSRPEIEPLVGFLGNTVVLRTPLHGDPTFADLTRQCHSTVLGATTHQDVPFSVVVEALRPDRMAGRIPLFQVGLTLLPRGISGVTLPLPNLAVRPIDVPERYAAFDISVDLADTADGRLDVSVEYATDLFDADRMHRFIDHYATALGECLRSPDGLVSEINILTPAERDQLQHGFEPRGRLRGLRRRVRAAARRLGSGRAIRADAAHLLVAAAAARTPGAVAVVDHDGTAMSYRDLDIAANQLAHRLRGRGVRPGDLVGICLPRGADLVTAVLAVWKAGGGYVPLDPQLPGDRVAALAADAGPALVVTRTDLATGYASVLTIDTERAALAAEPVTPPAGTAGPDEVACVLSTSGPHGAPRTLLIPHRALGGQVARLQDAFALRRCDRVLNQASYAFDDAIRELVWPLAVGATVVVAGPDRDARHLHQLVARHGVTTVHTSPARLRDLLDVPADGRPGILRQVFSSGESLPADTVRRHAAAWPGVRLHNLYGTTASLDVTAAQCAPDAAAGSAGHPIAGRRAYVLDRYLRPAPVGVPGQLFVAGPDLAHGYPGQPASTARRFLPDPYAQRPGQRMYATGDLARRRADGSIEQLGRIDRQVRIHGHRADLGVVEAALAALPGVRRSAVVPGGDGQLTAYLVTDVDRDLGGLRRVLADALPAYLIPTALVTVPELPSTPDGKLDLTRLPGPEADRYAEPHTDTQRWLAATWAELLGVDRVGTGDDFFALGGTSLLATQLVARISDALDIPIGTRHVVTNPTLDLLATRLDAVRSATPASVSPQPVGRSALKEIRS